MEKVVLVDKNDKEVGLKEKIKAHEDGDLHRAFSAFVFNKKNELMIQKRALDKYHNGGLWSNTCCSHPRQDETVKDAGERRLQEEMGFDCELKDVGSIIYKKKFSNGLTEHEYDYVLIGRYDDEPILNQEEAMDWKWISLDELKNDMDNNKNKYTYWFCTLVQKHLDMLTV